VLLTDDAVLEMRQDPGVVLGIEVPVEKLQQDAVIGTRIHGGVPRMAAPARPGAASLVFHPRIPVSGSEPYKILQQFLIFLICRAIGEIRPRTVHFLVPMNRC